MKKFILFFVVLTIPHAYCAKSTSKAKAEKTKVNKSEISAPLSASQMVEKADEHIFGKSFQATMEMEIDKAGDKRTLKFKAWNLGKEKALVKVLSPAKDRGNSNLRIDFNLWQYLPNVERVIKIPPSMMLQSWMGSDFSNDDLVKTSSLSRDYTHVLEKKELIDGKIDAYKIICNPKPDAPVVWGKVIVWLTSKEYVPFKHEYFSEKGELIRQMSGSEIQTFGSHSIPTIVKMETVKKNSSTTIKYSNVKFDTKLSDDLFTQANLRKPALD